MKHVLSPYLTQFKTALFPGKWVFLLLFFATIEMQGGDESEPRWFFPPIGNLLSYDVAQASLLESTHPDDVEVRDRNFGDFTAAISAALRAATRLTDEMKKVSVFYRDEEDAGKISRRAICVVKDYKEMPEAKKQKMWFSPLDRKWYYRSEAPAEGAVVYEKEVLVAAFNRKMREIRERLAVTHPEYVGRAPTALSCGHLYHRGCAKSLIDRKIKACPICKEPSVPRRKKDLIFSPDAYQDSEQRCPVCLDPFVSQRGCDEEREHARVGEKRQREEPAFEQRKKTRTAT